jgi:hypothetical protein
MESPIKTKTGNFIVFHSSHTGKPELFSKVGWYFEPTNYDYWDKYSRCYESQKDALDAAELLESHNGENFV